MPITGKVTGLQAIKAVLAAMPDVVRDRTGGAVLVTAQEVVRNAVARVPVDTGTLKEHIAFSYSPSTARAKVGIAGGTVRVKTRVYRASHYAHLVEFGARGGQMPAQAFLWPSFNGQLGPFESRMQAAQRASIDQLANVGASFL